MSTSIPTSAPYDRLSSVNQQDSSSNSSGSTSSILDNFPRHVESYSDERPPDLRPLDHSQAHRPSTAQNMAAVYPRPSSGSGTHPNLMMRGTTARHSYPSVNPNQSSSRPRPSEPSRQQTSLEPKKCWICYDDDESEIPGWNIHHTSSTHQPQTRRKWVKPCRCSLVAHESCLLTWITTYQITHTSSTSNVSPLSTPVHCPQCSATYNMAQPSSHLLTLIHRLKRPYDTVLSWSALGAVLLGVGITTSSYGLWASRCFLGQTRWNRWVLNSTGGFSFSKLFQLSLVGPILILSRTRQLDSVLPFLPISLILSNLGPSGPHHGSMANNLHVIHLDSVFPPEPALTLCLIPWARIGWQWIWSKVTYVVLAHEFKSLDFMGGVNGVPTDLGLEGGPQPAPLPNPIRPIEPNVEGPAGEGPNRLAPAQLVGQGVLEDEMVLDYTTLRGAIRIGMEALVLPAAAALAGNVLLHISKNVPWLRTALGIRTILHRSQSSKPFTDLWSRLSSSIGLTAIGLMNNKSGGSSDWMVESLVRSRNGTAEDPVWWRNTVGGALIVLVKDVMGLIEKVLKIRKLSQIKVLDA